MVSVARTHVTEYWARGNFCTSITNSIVQLVPVLSPFSTWQHFRRSPKVKAGPAWQHVVLLAYILV